MNKLHHCKKSFNFEDHGPAIFSCKERLDGTLWVDNDEYTSQVNFCPFCGYKAKKEAELVKQVTK